MPTDKCPIPFPVTISAFRPKAPTPHTHTHTHFITVPVDKQFRMQIHLCSPDARDVCVRTHVQKQFNLTIIESRLAVSAQRAQRASATARTCSAKHKIRTALNEDLNLNRARCVLLRAVYVARPAQQAPFGRTRAIKGANTS